MINRISNITSSSGKRGGYLTTTNQNEEVRKMMDRMLSSIDAAILEEYMEIKSQGKILALIVYVRVRRRLI